MCRYVFLAVSLMVVFGCGKAETKPVMSPDWIRGEPRVKGMICAVGASEPTFYTEDAKLYAAENARKELSRTIRTEVKTIMLDVATERGSSVDEATVMQVSSTVSEAVVENSKVIEYWRDNKGVASMRKGITYALCCMPRKINRESVTEKLKGSGGSGDLEDIGRTVDEIIDKMEEGE